PPSRGTVAAEPAAAGSPQAEASEASAASNPAVASGPAAASEPTAAAELPMSPATRVGETPILVLFGLSLVDVVGAFVFGGIGVLTVVLATTTYGSGEAGTGYLNGA